MRSVFIALTAMCLLSGAPAGLPAQNASREVPVADSTQAITIAEKALIKIYGRKKVQSERPFSAVLSDGVWHVTGTLYCTDGKGKRVPSSTEPCVGGVAAADIRQSDGRVLRTWHTM